MPGINSQKAEPKSASDLLDWADRIARSLRKRCKDCGDDVLRLIDMLDERVAGSILDAQDVTSEVKGNTQSIIHHRPLTPFTEAMVNQEVQNIIQQTLTLWQARMRVN